MVEAALARIAERDIVELKDPERKAAMVSNLLVVLCGDRAPQPVLNAGVLLPVTDPSGGSVPDVGQGAGSEFQQPRKQVLLRLRYAGP